MFSGLSKHCILLKILRVRNLERLCLGGYCLIHVASVGQQGLEDPYLSCFVIRMAGGWCFLASFSFCMVSGLPGPFHVAWAIHGIAVLRVHASTSSMDQAFLGKRNLSVFCKVRSSSCQFYGPDLETCWVTSTTFYWS